MGKDRWEPRPGPPPRIIKEHPGPTRPGFKRPTSPQPRAPFPGTLTFPPPPTTQRRK
jgi:hypothetical protein